MRVTHYAVIGTPRRNRWQRLRDRLLRRTGDRVIAFGQLDGGAELPATQTPLYLRLVDAADAARQPGPYGTLIREDDR